MLRQGRVSKAQRRAHDTLLPRYGVAFDRRWKRDRVLRKQGIQRALLRRGRAPLPQDVASYAAFDEIFPSVGELGEAE